MTTIFVLENLNWNSNPWNFYVVPLTYCPNWNVWTAAKGAKMCWYFSIQSNDSVERDDFDHSSLWAIPHNILCPNSDLTLTNRSFIMIKFPPLYRALFRLKSSTVTARIVLREQTSEKNLFSDILALLLSFMRK